MSLHKVAKKPLGYMMSKSEAEAIADELRTQIRDGHCPTIKQAKDEAAVAHLAERYLRERVNVPGRKPDPIAAATNYVRIIRRLVVGGRPFEQHRLASVTAQDLEALREARRGELHETAQLRAEGKTKGRIVLPLEKDGEIGVEHLMATLRNMFSWAARWGLVAGSPFKQGGEVVVQVRNSTVVRERDRRLVGDEEARLIAAAQPHLRGVIVALLETGCRVGELLSLQWKDVHEEVILVRAEKAKTSRARGVPITAELRRVLDSRRKGPDGEDHAPERYVFGNEVGERVKRVRHAWDNTCKRAGIEDLHIHDLRREFGSRLMESGVRDHEVKEWLGHTNVTTTSRYLKTNGTRLRGAAAMFERRRIDGGLTETQAVH